jgi:SAM-dependent methyltransferase
MTSKNLNACLCCGSNELNLTLDLKWQPPANSYRKNLSNDVKEYPLALNLCKICWHSQLSFNVDRNEIFDHYIYASGTSHTLEKFFRWFSEALKNSIGENKKVLEIAANDGSLIKAMLKDNFNCTGIDPAKNIVEKAQANNLPIILGYWPDEASKIDESYDAIVCMNVLAHVDNPLDFLIACKNKLTKEGVIIIQPSQARMFENGEFDTIYHEHISFFNTQSINHLANRAGLELVGAALVKIHGDSPLYFLKIKGAESKFINVLPFKQGEFGINEDLYHYEQKVGLFTNETYHSFSQKAADIIYDLTETVNSHRKKGYKIVFVGAAAKALTIINSGKIQPDHILDESPLKIGLYAPGCNLVVEPLLNASNIKDPCLFIISAWNFKTELVAKLIKSGITSGSKFYTYFPSARLWEESI